LVEAKARGGGGVDVVIAKVKGKERISEGIYRISFYAPYIASSAVPGQFVNIRVSDGFDPFLRRPMSIASVGGEGRFDIIFKVVGRGTEILSRLRPGDRVDILGPLGRGFSTPREDRTPILVGGGTGIAPLIFLSSWLFERGFRPVALIGARTSSELIGLKELRDNCGKVFISTEDGSMGRKGSVTDLLEIGGGFRSDTSHEEDELIPVLGRVEIYASGPLGMISHVARFSIRRSIPCQISLETIMGCGYGACMGCAWPMADGNGYLMVCKDGPVFDARDVRL
jgi:dihydroorotate dehydrogenase electron transfer subunit